VDGEKGKGKREGEKLEALVRKEKKKIQPIAGGRKKD